MKTKSANASDKFKELKDVRDSTFADVIVQLVKQPYDTSDKITLWVSDFTENDSFFHFAFKGFGYDSGQAPDPFGYGVNLPYGAGTGGEWKGPFGKRSMQVTCFEPHTSFIREQRLSTGSWVMLRNLHIRYGNNAANLEGYLRSDWKIHVIQMDITDTEAPDPRLKEAVRRFRDYEREKEMLLQAGLAGKKRKSDLAEMQPPQAEKPRRNKKPKQKAKKPVKVAEVSILSQMRTTDQGESTVMSNGMSTETSAATSTAYSKGTLSPPPLYCI